MSERFLLLARTQNGISPGPRRYVVNVSGTKPYRCMGCGTTIARGEEHARGTSSGRICAVCVSAATDATQMLAPPESPTVRVRVSPDAMAILMDGAADQLDGRVTVIAIQWDGDVTSGDAQRRSRSWAVSMSDKPYVVATRVRVYGNPHESTLDPSGGVVSSTVGAP